jgi:Dolichyl-phosphate-mannose-protein mannosyltransferase
MVLLKKLVLHLKKYTNLDQLTLTVGGFWIYFYYYSKLQFSIDDNVIFDPVMDSIKGIPRPNFTEYPPFLFTFWESAFRVSKLILPNMEPLVQFHILNALIAALNVFLFFQICKKFFPKPFPLLGGIFFLFCPVVFLSAVSFKPDALVILVQLLYMLSLDKIFSGKAKPVDHVWSGILCGAGLGIKYSPLFVVHLFALFFLIKKRDGKSIFATIKSLVSSSSLYYFLGGLAFFLLIFFPRFFLFEDPLFGNSHYLDPSWTNYPNAFRAVDEWGSFPLGRFSSIFVTYLPITMGFVPYFLLLIAFISGSIYQRFFWVGLSYGLLYLLSLGFFSLTRNPHWFGPAAPAIILGAVFMIQKIYIKIQKPIPKPMLVALVLPIILLSSIQSLDLVNTYNFLEKTWDPMDYKKTPQALRIPTLNLVFSWNGRSYWDKLDLFIRDRKPPRIYYLNTLIQNFCEYKKNPDYKRVCSFFKDDLEKGKTNYQKIGTFTGPKPILPYFWRKVYFLEFNYFERRN